MHEVHWCQVTALHVSHDRAGTGDFCRTSLTELLSVTLCRARLPRKALPGEAAQIRCHLLVRIHL